MYGTNYMSGWATTAGPLIRFEGGGTDTSKTGAMVLLWVSIFQTPKDVTGNYRTN